MRAGIKFLFTVIFCLFITAGIRAQTFFEGLRGQTSIKLPVGGLARINTTASSLKIGYYYNRSDKDVVFGVDASGISNNGFAPLVTNKELSPAANINFNLGFKNISTDDSNLTGFDYLNIKLGFGTAQYRLIDTNAAFDQQFSSESFTNVNLGVSYNYYHKGNMIFGIFGSYDRTNNIPGLNRITIKDSTPITTIEGGTVRTVESEFTAWQGELEAVDQFSMFLDYVYLPDYLSNRVALSVYSRSYFNNIYKITNGGFGVYLNREDQPLKIVGGLIYEFNDLFDYRNADTSLGDRGTLGIVVGYNF